MAAMRNRRAFDHVEAFITEGGLYFDAGQGS
jgi:hypothetical protein